MKVVIATPYAVDSLNGNTVTSKRIASLLESEGIEVAITQSSEVDASSLTGSDVMIALHARKSAGAVEVFKKVNPTGKVIVFMTGTDLYEDLPRGCEICLKTLRDADTVVVSQEASLVSIPDEFKTKSHVVHKSIVLPELSEEVEREPGLFTVVGHLREVKQPFMIAEALKKIKNFKGLSVRSLGGEMDNGYAGLAREYGASDMRYQWLGERSYSESLQWIQRSTATVNTSLSEGGANSVGESIMLGVPVLASFIEGNVGMLGADYSGYFRVNDPTELAELMQRIIEDDTFLEQLKKEVVARQAYFCPELEREGWLNLLKNE